MSVLYLSVLFLKTPVRQQLIKNGAGEAWDPLENAANSSRAYWLCTFMVRVMATVLQHLFGNLAHTKVPLVTKVPCDPPNMSMLTRIQTSDAHASQFVVFSSCADQRFHNTTKQPIIRTHCLLGYVFYLQPRAVCQHLCLHWTIAFRPITSTNVGSLIFKFCSLHLNTT